jgi:3',5'-cyclic AMP phosphodiesterase CpdA
MDRNIDRRDFLRLAGLGGVAWASGLGLSGCASQGGAARSDFHFVQLSDTHWGYSGPANPHADTTLVRAIDAVNALADPPAFVVFTGDLTHLTLDGAQRRERMAKFRDIASGLKVRSVRFLPGEHDASVDGGEAYREFFGATHYSFDHEGVHFLALDNVSDPRGALGEEQLRWMADDLARRPAGAPVVVFAHRPLFDLAPAWGWATQDGARAVEILSALPRAVVFYGHIHQEHTHQSGNVTHLAASSLIFPLPAPMSGPDHKPIAWNAEHPYAGIGWREVRHAPGGDDYAVEQKPMAGA